MNINEPIKKDNIITRWETRTKLIGFLILIFAISMIEDIKLLALTLLITIALFILTRISFKYLLNKFRIPSLFLVFLGVGLIFFTKGTTIFNIGPIEVSKEGLEAFVIFSIRFISILTIVIILFASTPFVHILKAMREFKISEILIDMTMYTYRYFFELKNQMQNMQVAMNLRGFDKKRLKSVGKYASLIGTIFIRSFDQSQRVYNAMMMRGYGQGVKGNKDLTKKIRKNDILLLLGLISLAFSLVFAQYFML